MTTSRSPLRVLKAQADAIASMLKAFERGEKVNLAFAAKLIASRGRPSVKFAVVMDDKMFSIEMPWATIRSTSEVGISELLLREMRGARERMH